MESTEDYLDLIAVAGTEEDAWSALLPALTRVAPPHPVAFVVGLAIAGSAAILLGGSRTVAQAAARPLTEP